MSIADMYYPSETQINNIGFDLLDVMPNGCRIEMTKDVCTERCYPEEVPFYSRHITIEVKMPLPDNHKQSFDGFMLYHVDCDDFTILGYFSTLPQGVKYFKDNFEKIARKIDAYGKQTLHLAGFNFEKVELPNIYTNDVINIDNLFDLEEKEEVDNNDSKVQEQVTE